MVKKEEKNIMKEISEDENLSECLTHVGTWISAADNKVSIGLGIFSVLELIITFIFTDQFDLLKKLSKCECKLPNFISVIILIGLSLLLFAVTLFIYFLALSPRFKGKITNKPKKLSQKKIDKRNEKIEKLENPNSYFYEDVALFLNFSSFKSHKSKFYNINDESEKLLKEIYYNSCICHIKMHCFKFGLWTSFCAIITGLGGILLLVFSVL